MVFKFTPLAIPEVVLIQPRVFTDNRGFFVETYKESEYLEGGLGVRFVQDNHSRSVRRVLRGLHFQRPPKALAKLVRAIRSEIYVVAVDVRVGSPTFGKWVGQVLSEDNHRIMYIPEGFAHGFVTLSEYADVWYKMTNEYSPEHDTGIRWNDPNVAIAWPIKDPILSEKDQTLPMLREARTGFEYMVTRAT